VLFQKVQNATLMGVTMMDANLRVDSTGKKSVLCKEHYKEYKKESKDDRELERARYDKF
jgi:hypothetical protein